VSQAARYAQASCGSNNVSRQSGAGATCEDAATLGRKVATWRGLILGVHAGCGEPEFCGLAARRSAQSREPAGGYFIGPRTDDGHGGFAHRRRSITKPPKFVRDRLKFGNPLAEDGGRKPSRPAMLFDVLAGGYGLSRVESALARGGRDEWSEFTSAGRGAEPLDDKLTEHPSHEHEMGSSGRECGSCQLRRLCPKPVDT
jgi:hypothetical protein